ncbi:LysR family transcriptional regulator [bacterium]|nr:LysR family transcriptional regulator [bacterium]
MYKSNINLNLYKVFYEVAKYGSFSETAKQTFMSQPAISKSIKNLEEELGSDLFYRKPNGVLLTEKGKELLFFVEKSYNNLVLAERNMIETENLERGKLSIGMPSNVGSFFLFDKVINFHKKFPNIEVTIITGSTSKLIELLDSHKIDFIIDTSPINIETKDIKIKKLDTVNYCFAVHKGNSQSKISSLEELKNVPLILPIPGTANRMDLDYLLREKNIIVDNVINIHTSEMIISGIKKDLGIGYIIENLVTDEPEIEILKIANLPTVDINFIYNPLYLTTAPKKFITEYLNIEI